MTQEQEQDLKAKKEAEQALTLNDQVRALGCDKIIEKVGSKPIEVKEKIHPNKYGIMNRFSDGNFLYQILHYSREYKKYCIKYWNIDLDPNDDHTIIFYDIFSESDITTKIRAQKINVEKQIFERQATIPQIKSA